jgi:crotonobetainyl-CoA:carnitine CoA-transferase CaiB-like acyl-CoA transferase
VSGPLAGLRVLELAAELSAYPGKLLADLGANVVVIEPPGGSVTRSYGPFAGPVDAGGGPIDPGDPGGLVDPEASLYWRHYNTSKRGIVLDLTGEDGRTEARRLIAGCDVLLESSRPAELTALGALGLDPAAFQRTYPRLVWVSITPFGRRGDPPDVPVTDLTLLAGGGPAYVCGYDDHSLPPVRGAGGQSAHIAGSFAFAAALTALLHRQASGRGQYIDVSVDAALNVSSELSTTQYLADGQMVQRQTGRHAMLYRTAPTQVKAADGKYVVLGFPPRAAKDYASILEWLDSLGLRASFADAALLELAVERGGVSVTEASVDPIAQEIFSAARGAMLLLAERLPAHEFFLGFQRRGIVVGVVTAPEEAINDPHLVARGYPTPVTDPRSGREEIHPGPPYRFSRTPWRISRPAPRLAEHTEEIVEKGWTGE